MRMKIIQCEHVKAGDPVAADIITETFFKGELIGRAEVKVCAACSGVPL
jgi:hypothetical protein